MNDPVIHEVRFDERVAGSRKLLAFSIIKDDGEQYRNAVSIGAGDKVSDVIRDFRVFADMLEETILGKELTPILKKDRDNAETNS